MSRATVSNVLRDHPHVRPQTRERVLAAAQALGYHPNVAARSLARGGTKTLGVVISDFGHPWAGGLAGRMEREARKHNHTLFVVSTGGEGPEAEAACVRTLVEHRVAAIIFVDFSNDPAVIGALPADTPIVFVSTQGVGGPNIVVDYRLSAQLAVSHLVNLGHQRIGFVVREGPDPRSFLEIFIGCQQAMLGAGLLSAQRSHVDVELPVVTCDGEFWPSIEEMLSSTRRPTAIFAVDDLAALEVLERAYALRLRVPDDLSVVGFDDIGIAALPNISLTTVAQPAAEFATRAVETALAMIAGSAEQRNYQLLQPALIVRKTTAPPSAS
jgi:DNA-binding LacI/PurR family transcriptional regulator